MVNGASWVRFAALAIATGFASPSWAAIDGRMEIGAPPSRATAVEASIGIELATAGSWAKCVMAKYNRMLVDRQARFGNIPGSLIYWEEQVAGGTIGLLFMGDCFISN